MSAARIQAQLGLLLAAGWRVTFDPSPDGANGPGASKVAIEVEHPEPRRAYQAVVLAAVFFDSHTVADALEAMGDRAGVNGSRP